MPYRVQVLTTGARARAGLQTALQENILREADITPAFAQGLVDDDGMRRLAELGLPMSVLARLDDPAPAVISRGGTFRARTFGVSVGGGPDRGASAVYYRLLLSSLLTPAVRERLETLGVEVLERMLGSEWAVRVHGSPNEIREYDAVVSLEPAARAQPPVRPFAVGSGGVRSSSRDAAPGLPGSTDAFEAMLQPGADAAAVAAAIAAAGGDAVRPTRRTVRFIADQAGAAAAAAIDGVAEVGIVGAARPLHDLLRPLVGVHGGVAARPGGLDGEGELVGIADTGLDSEHPDFDGRVEQVVALGRPGDGSDPDGHGTHVAGTVAGDGTASNGDLAGMAPRARIFFQSLLDERGGLGGLPDDVGDLFQQAHDAGVRVHNNSWGIFLHARYPGTSLQVDAFVDEHPDFLPVIAAGNDGSCLPGDNAGGPGLVDLPSMAAPGTAKNALVVGASRSSRTGLGYADLTYSQTWPEHFGSPPIGDATVSGDPAGLAAFSARGPTDDFRIKPDVVAPGTDIASTRSSLAPLRKFWGAYPNNPGYAVMGGTSMACPVVTGLAVLVRQYYRRDRSHLPSAALLRATIVNGTQRLDGSDATAHPMGEPNFHQGFGRVNLQRTVPTDGADFALEFVDTMSVGDAALQFSGDMRSFDLEVREPGELRLCLAWSDPAAHSLQNSLFLTLEAADGTVLQSNADIARFFVFRTPLPPGLPAETVFRDPHNNLHVLRVAAAAAGTYRLTVANWDLLRPPQDFALVATGAIGPLVPVDVA